MKPTFYLKKAFTFIFILLISTAFGQKKFKLVLDAGHGGHDTGTNRKYGDLGHIKEKDVALEVTLMVGKLLEKRKDFKLIYTRKTDTYPTLGERTDLANNNHADLFISIHCNAASRKSAHGTETFVQGPDQNDTNLEVAKRENSVIFLDEKDKAKFASYNPKSPESLIALKIQQNKYLQKSLILGGYLEKNFTQKDKRFSRGVKQKNLHVLRLNAMPSVLIEMGFISNHKEAAYLASRKGKKEIAQSIYEAIVSYKEALDKKSGNYSKKNTKKKKKEKKKEKKSTRDFRVLFMSSSRRYNQNSPNFKGLKHVLTIKENNVYKYYYSITNYPSVKRQNIKTAKDAGFRNAYAVGFIPNQKLNTGYYTIELEPTKKKRRSDKFKKLSKVKRKRRKGLYYYSYGQINTLEKAIFLQKNLEKMGFKNTVVKKVTK